MLKTTALEGLSYWSRAQPERGIDFNGFLWSRAGGNVLVDPLELDASERSAVEAAGGARFIVLTNFDHLRAAPELRGALNAKVLAPAEERERFGDQARHVDQWYTGTEDLPPELRGELEVFALRGGKSSYEAALYLRGPGALVFGDLVRSHRSGHLHLLPAEKLRDRAAVVESLRPLRDLPVRAVLLGDGDSFFFAGAEVLAGMLDGLEG